MPNKSIKTVIDYLAHQDINAQPAQPIRYAISASASPNDITWSSVGFKPLDTLPTQSAYMSLASMAAVEQLDLKHDTEFRVLDICAAPGMKSLYTMLAYPSVNVYANDLSEQRLIRMKSLYKEFDVRAEHITKRDGTAIAQAYEPASFDRIILDAPCSGEGVILGDDPSMLDAWSPAKVKRLQQLQIKILKQAWQLLKPNGRLIYATCTLNKNENERVIHKALKINLAIKEITLSPRELEILQPGQARRILPSDNSIGFFYAALDKSLTPEE